jgi:hypothetical protein
VQTWVSFIRTYAEGSFEDETGFIGYYVWARYGFNAPLSEEEIDSLPTDLVGCTSLNEIMLKEGQDWWRHEGSGRDMIFMLSENEPSLGVLRNYLREKGVKEQL